MIALELIVLMNAILMLIGEIAMLRRNSIMDKLIQDVVIIKDRIESIERYIINLLEK